MCLTFLHGLTCFSCFLSFASFRKISGGLDRQLSGGGGGGNGGGSGSGGSGGSDGRNAGGGGGNGGGGGGCRWPLLRQVAAHSTQSRANAGYRKHMLNPGKVELEHLKTRISARFESPYAIATPMQSGARPQQ